MGAFASVLGVDRACMFIFGLVADVERGLTGVGGAVIRSVGRLATGGTAVGTRRDGDSAGRGTGGTTDADWPVEPSPVPGLVDARGAGGDAGGPDAG